MKKEKYAKWKQNYYRNKLKYYKSQLETFGNENNPDWEMMINSIKRQLKEKMQELYQKYQRDNSKVDDYQDNKINYESVPVPRLSGLERKRKRLGNQMNHLNMLSKD